MTTLVLIYVWISMIMFIVGGIAGISNGVLEKEFDVFVGGVLGLFVGIFGVIVLCLG